MDSFYSGIFFFFLSFLFFIWDTIFTFFLVAFLTRFVFNFFFFCNSGSLNFFSFFFSLEKYSEKEPVFCHKVFFSSAQN